MWGAIIGDIAGSIYEYEQMKEIKNINCNEIIPANGFFSDDTILTIAIADAIINNKDYEENLKLYGKRYEDYKPDHKPYFKTIFSPGFMKWVNEEKEGTSIGNGAMMRISPIGYMFQSEQEVIKNAKLATIPSHNSEEAIKSSKIVALIIYYARMGMPKEEIINKLNLEIKYKGFKKFNSTCNETLGNCLYALFTSYNFEDSVKKVISYGGDTDTNASIVGAMAEAIYGIDNTIIDKVKEKLPIEFIEVIKKEYQEEKNNYYFER